MRNVADHASISGTFAGWPGLPSVNVVASALASQAAGETNGTILPWSSHTIALVPQCAQAS